MIFRLSRIATGVDDGRVNQVGGARVGCPVRGNCRGPRAPEPPEEEGDEQRREEILPPGVQEQPLPGAEEPVQVRRLLHEPPRSEGAAAVDRRVAGCPRQTLSEELADFDELHQLGQEEGFHRAQKRLRRKECEE